MDALGKLGLLAVCIFCMAAWNLLISPVTGFSLWWVVVTGCALFVIVDLLLAAMRR